MKPPYSSFSQIWTMYDTIPAGGGTFVPQWIGGAAWLLPWLPASLVWLCTLIFIGFTIAGFKRERTLQKTIDRFASPVAGALFALLALVVGVISQFYSSKITSGFPLTYADRSPISATLGFWVSVVLMLVLGIAYYAATGRQRLQELAILQNESRDLRRHTTEVVNTIRTLPPEGFMRDYPALSANILAAYTRALEDRSFIQIQEAIRSTLRNTALMAHRFSRRGAPEKFRANVMRFRSASVLGPISSWSDEDRVLYPAGFEPAAYRGALVFDPALATRASSENSEVLEGTSGFRIIIPEPPRDHRPGNAAEGRLRVLPGSAVAFLLGRPYIAFDTLDMRQSQENYDLPEAVITASDTHFRTGAGKGVRSFVSFPLFAEPGRMEGETIGALNIEFEDTEIFNNEQRTIEQFALAIAPVHFVIVWLLTLLEEEESTETGDLS